MMKMALRHVTRQRSVGCRDLFLYKKDVQIRNIRTTRHLLAQSEVPKDPSKDSRVDVTHTSKSNNTSLFGEESDGKTGTIKHRTQYNIDPFSLKPTSDHYEYPLVDQEWLNAQQKRPRGVRMLARDFIHDALYNPSYGYFSRHAVLLPDGKTPRKSSSSQKGYDFVELSNDRAFMVAVEERYKEFEESIEASDKAAVIAARERVDAKVKDALGPLLKKKKNGEHASQTQTSDALKKPKSRVIPLPPPGSAKALDAAQRKGRMDLARQLLNEKETDEHDRDVKAMAARQVWHTPTELFQPYFAEAIAKYMIEEKPEGKPLCVYEVGAGSGTLANDILNYVQSHHPDLYKDMSYQIIEISPRLANQQREKLSEHITKSPDRIRITNKSVLDWQEQENKNCFFLAMEVFDNLTHDVIRYSTDTLQPYQAIVSIDSTGDMHELWEPVQDPKIKQYLEMQNKENHSSVPEVAPTWMKYTPGFLRSAFTRNVPFYPNLTKPEYIPTGSLQLLEVLANKFPKHRLIMADFDSLPDNIVGKNAPVVQTRLNGTMIAVTKYTVHQGFFDIFFPTNFKDLQKMHDRIMKESISTDSENSNQQSKSKILSHREFLQTHGDLSKTTCKDGSNPMLSWYANASWFLS